MHGSVMVYDGNSVRKTEQPILASWIVRPGHTTYLSCNFAKLTDDEENYYMMYCISVQAQLRAVDFHKQGQSNLAL